MIMSLLILLGYHSMRYFTLIATMSCLFMPSVMAQKQTSINEYLGSALTSYWVKQDAENISFLENYNYNLPLIKSVDLRSETRDFLLKRQEYTVRVKPNNINAIAYQKKVYQNKIEGIEIENQMRFNEELKKRYLSLIDYFFTQEVIGLEKKRQGQLKDKLKVLSQSIYNTNFDIKNLLETEDELLRLDLKLVNLQETQNIQMAQLRQLLSFQGDSLQLNFSNLISPSQITQQPLQSISDEPLLIKRQKLKLETLENENELGLAKSNQLLDYVQAKYGGSNDIFFNENFSIGIGLNIPFFGNNRQRKGDYYFQKITEESELATLEENVAYEQELVRGKFENAIINFESMRKQLSNSSISSILETYKKMEGVSPLLLLNLVSLETEKKIQTQKSKHELYIAYIEILANQGKLFEQPLRNYLSSEIEFILQ